MPFMSTATVIALHPGARPGAETSKQREPQNGRWYQRIPQSNTFPILGLGCRPAAPNLPRRSARALKCRQADHDLRQKEMFDGGWDIDHKSVTQRLESKKWLRDSYCTHRML